MDFTQNITVTPRQTSLNPTLRIFANLISKVVVYANDKKIYISGMEGAYKIVDLMGRTISQGFVNNSVSVDVMTGLYIVVTENGVKKVSVR